MITCQDIIQKRRELWDENHDIEQDRVFRQAVAEKITDPGLQGELLREEIKGDASRLIEMTFVIVNKQKETVPFFLNDVQLQFRDQLLSQIRKYESGETHHIKFLILKGRQQGFTSFITAYQLANAIIERNFAGYTVAHKRDDTAEIFEKKAKFPYESLPDELKPTEKFNNKREFLFDKLNSSWGIDTAEGKSAGRSKTLFFFHGSEAAFWANLQTLLNGLKESLAQGAIEILETTANGYNEFKELWDEAKAGENNYIPLFYEWWHTPEYRLGFENQEIEKKFKYKVKSRADEFFTKLDTLRKSKNLDWEQLYWYYNKKKDLKENLPQEYPCNDKEAFLHSGRPYFDLDKVDKMLLQVDRYKPVRTSKGGSVIVWNKPQKHQRYCIGADVAEGLPEGDSSSAIIYLEKNWEQVAKIHGHFAPEVFGNILVDFAIEYNNAYLMIENNNHGWSTLNTVYHQRKYRNIHFTTNQTKSREKPSKKMGWSTTEASKYIMLDELDAAIRDENLIIKDKDLLEQLREVVYDEKGRVNVSGKDMVVANAIAWQGRKYIASMKAGAWGRS